MSSWLARSKHHEGADALLPFRASAPAAALAAAIRRVREGGEQQWHVIVPGGHRERDRDLRVERPDPALAEVLAGSERQAVLASCQATFAAACHVRGEPQSAIRVGNAVPGYTPLAVGQVIAGIESLQDDGHPGSRDARR